MTGGEIFAAGKAVEAIGKKALVEDETTRDFLLRVAEGTPEMMAAARSMAARIAVKERVKLKLYQPFARMLGVSMAYFEDTFPQEMGAKIADIPDENLVTPPASIAVPALQGLSYTFEEGSLKELYLNLLATASDNRRANQAHPAFAEIIKQLAPDEAKLLREVLPRRHLPIARIMDEIGRPKGTFDLLMSYLLPIVDAKGEPWEEPRVPTWVDNWKRLGLVDITYDEYLPAKAAYDWVQTRPEYVRFARRAEITHLMFDEGLITSTNFGRQFLRAVTE